MKLISFPESTNPSFTIVLNNVVGFKKQCDGYMHHLVVNDVLSIGFDTQESIDTAYNDLVQALLYVGTTSMHVDGGS